MEYYVVQTALLLLAAYVLGAFVGCLLRRLAGGGSNGRAGSDGVMKTGAVQGGAMDQPAITTSGSLASSVVSSAATSPAQSAGTDTARFEQALSGPGDDVSSTAKTARASGGAARSLPQMSPVATAAATAAATVAARSLSPTSQPAGVLAETTDGSISGDDLTLIRGIDGALQNKLQGLGISQFGQIANWSAIDVESLPGDIKDQVSSDNWIEQAQILGGGGTTEYARLKLSGAAPEVVSPQSEETPSLVSSVTPTLQASNQQAAAAQTPLAANDDGADLTGLRSVRSQAFRKTGGASSDNGEPDDLKRIRGVGLLIEKKLNSLDIFNYEQIANWSSAEIDRISQLLDFKGRIERENWVEQARILSSGGHTEFSRRADND